MLFYLLLLLPAVVVAQSCYYPNGDEVVAEAVGPCGDSLSGGTQCCPLNWVCLNNGLCFDPVNDYFGRYSCTDQSWKGKGCPGFCQTDNGSGGGNQAVKECSTGQYCCNANRVSFDCCTKPGVAFFSLDEGKTIATITSAITPGPASPKTTSPPSSKSSASSTTSKDPVSSKATGSTSISSGSTVDPRSTTSVSSTSSGPSAANTADTNNKDPATAAKSSSSSKVGVIVGAICGVIALLLLFALIHFLRRRHNKHQANSEVNDDKVTPTVTSPQGKRFSWLPQRNNNTPTTDKPAVNELEGFPVQQQNSNFVELPGDITHSPPQRTPDYPVVNQQALGQPNRFSGVSSLSPSDQTGSGPGSERSPITPEFGTGWRQSLNPVHEMGHEGGENGLGQTTNAHGAMAQNFKFNGTERVPENVFELPASQAGPTPHEYQQPMSQRT
ncbi:hypothetical protein BT63DRAFT_410348 [Microthyrium microscopicum]|uniref:Mid2 domain-containing protein n=1 Tax=Microthyrium microscopicum TaxID=703497 RepID=A0A6A6UM50_9PEZI|nr:hypothetical protein BT63DRAFT_410348 [Microthyrium microscopicum]